MIPSHREKPLILIVDDDVTLRIIARETLEKEGFAVEEAENGMQAMALTQELSPDLLLSDVVMQPMNGYTLCERIRNSSDYANIPILMMTSRDDFDSINKAYEVGATDFITKPINWTILGHRIRYMLRFSRSTEELRRSENKNQALLSAIPDALFRINRECDILDYKLSKYLDGSFFSNLDSGGNLDEIFSSPISQQIKSYLELSSSQSELYVFETSIIKHGKTSYLECRIVPLIPDEFLILLRDITGRREAEADLRKLSRAVEQGPGMVVITNRQGKIEYVNSKFLQITGYQPDEVVGQKPSLLKSGQHSREFYQELWETITAGNDWHGEICNKKKDGSLIWINALIAPVRDQNGETTHFVAIEEDITEKKEIEERIKRLAYYDTLTGLPNRELFFDRFKVAKAQAIRNQKQLAILFLDLNRFKIINDILGHAVGDQLLKDVAMRISGSVRKADTVARMGGDEFLVLLYGIHTSAVVVSVIKRIIHNLEKPFQFEKLEFHIGASIGISIFPEDGDDAITLLKNADIAMYQAKEEGKDYCFFAPSMNIAVIERMELENGLRQAIAQNQFIVFYQPQIDVKIGSIVGVEALVRWQHPTQGLIPPNHFIPLAEETGLIIPITEMVLQIACTQMKKWLDDGVPLKRISVNISAMHFKHKKFIDTVFQTLQETELEPKYLELELTERTFLENTEEIIQTLNQLKKLGITLSIDDFGTGYSSLNYLKRLPIDRLKIDYTFVKGIIESHQDKAIIAAIIAMARSLGMNVTAEGVETEEQMNFLIERECDDLQGFLFSKPIGAESLTDLITHYVGNPGWMPS